jgi:hypothetical protein
MWSGKRSLSKVGLVIPLLSLLLAAVACGTAAPPVEPVVEERVVEGVEKVVVATPTPEPEAASVPQEVEVHPGKVTVMIGSFGTERFDYAFARPRASTTPGFSTTSCSPQTLRMGGG